MLGDHRLFFARISLCLIQKHTTLRMLFLQFVVSVKCWKTWILFVVAVFDSYFETLVVLLMIWAGSEVEKLRSLSRNLQLSFFLVLN